MAEILLPSLRDRKRVLAVIRWGGYEGPTLYRWSCSVCGYAVSEVERLDAEQKMNAHTCDAGWCAIPATHPSQPSGLLDYLQVTTEDRERWARDRELRDLAQARARTKPRL